MSTVDFKAALLTIFVAIVLMVNMSFAHRIGVRSRKSDLRSCKSDLTVSPKSDLGFRIGFDFFVNAKPRSGLAF
jgi:hypothetical protein